MITCNIQVYKQNRAFSVLALWLWSSLLPETCLDPTSLHLTDLIFFPQIMWLELTGSIYTCFTPLTASIASFYYLFLMVKGFLFLLFLLCFHGFDDPLRVERQPRTNNNNKHMNRNGIFSPFSQLLWGKHDLCWEEQAHVSSLYLSRHIKFKKTCSEFHCPCFISLLARMTENMP